jgi:tetratricopeptide (TPR) repeat protein
MIRQAITRSYPDQAHSPSGDSNYSAQVELFGAPPRAPSWKALAVRSATSLLRRSFFTLLKLTPSHPVILLCLASICLELRRAGMACQALSRLSASNWQRCARPQQVVKAAAMIARLGYPAELENLLRAVELLLQQAVAREPDLAAPRLELARLLHEQLRYVEALDIAAEGVRRFPSRLDLRLLLARIQLQMRLYADAASTIEALLAAAPEHAWGWYELGRIGRLSYERPGLGDAPFERAVELAEKDAALITAVAKHFLYDLNFAKAAECYERLLQIEPATRRNFVVCRQYAACLNACARTDEAKEIIAGGLDSCRTIAATSDGEAWQVLKREEALLLWEGKQFQEADAALRSIWEACVGTSLL